MQPHQLHHHKTGGCTRHDGVEQERPRLIFRQRRGAACDERVQSTCEAIAARPCRRRPRVAGLRLPQEGDRRTSCRSPQRTPSFFSFFFFLSSLHCKAQLTKLVLAQDILDREFPSVLALGGAAAGVAEHLQEIPGVKRIVQLDSSRTHSAPICHARTPARRQSLTHCFARPSSAQSCSRSTLGRRSCECVGFLCEHACALVCLGSDVT